MKKHPAVPYQMLSLSPPKSSISPICCWQSMRLTCASVNKKASTLPVKLQIAATVPMLALQFSKTLGRRPQSRRKRLARQMNISSAYHRSRKPTSHQARSSFQNRRAKLDNLSARSTLRNSTIRITEIRRLAKRT